MTLRVVFDVLLYLTAGVVWADFAASGKDPDKARWGIFELLVVALWPVFVVVMLVLMPVIWLIERAKRKS